MTFDDKTIALKTWPERIYLQHGEDGDPIPEFAGDVDGRYTWCSDQIASSDVEYVRADIHADEITRLQQQVAELQAERESLVKKALEAAASNWIEAHGFDKYGVAVSIRSLSPSTILKGE